MPDDQPSPEQRRAAQRDTWRRALAKAAATARTRRGVRKPAQVKAGMHRKSQPPKEGTQ